MKRCLLLWAMIPGLLLADGVRYRGIFVNDEDWGLRPWAVRHFGQQEQIGARAYAEIFRLMKEDGLNLLWPAMHEGGYEFSSRPENLVLAEANGITIDTSHCEPMLRNNCYLSKEDKKKWSWTAHRDFVTDYWREGVRRGAANDVLWTLGMRGIHDGGMKDGKTSAEKIAILEEVFATQTNLLAEVASRGAANTLFCPYKEVLPLYNAGLKVPTGTTIMWVNDNFGYIRRLAAPSSASVPQGIYWHLSYHGRPHGYIHLATTPPAFMWYELAQKCWNNGVRDVWMVNAGDVFQAELLLNCYGQIAANPEQYGADAQNELLARAVQKKFDLKDERLVERIVAHLNEYYTLGFNRKPEHMCIQWSRALPSAKKTELLARYKALLAEDLALEAALAQQGDSDAQMRCETYFRLIGFSAQFLAQAGIIHLEGKDKAYAYSVLNPLYARWDALEGGKWSGFWCDTVDEQGGKRQPTTHNRWSSQMQWAWNEPTDPAKKDGKGVSRNDYVATAYRADVPEPAWLEPSACVAANGGAWTRVRGLGTSGQALALLPVKPGIGEGAMMTFSLPSFSSQRSLVLQFLPDYALYPGLNLGVNVQFDAAATQFVAVPKSDSNIGEHDRVRNAAVQDNFIRVEVPVPAGAQTVTIAAGTPGVVVDRVGISTNVPYVAPWKGNRAAAVSFTFDDGIRDQYELAFPRLKEYGLKGTFFLNGGPIEKQTPTRQGAPRMTWEMVKEMSDAGMEMSNHGLNHANHGRNPRAVVEVDISSNDVLIARHTGKRPITFAYPNNARNREWSAQVVNPGRVGARTFQKSFGGKHDLASGRKLFRAAKENRSWLVLMTHAIKFGYDQWRNPEHFYALLKEVSEDEGLWVGTFAEVSIYQRLREETKVVCTPSEKGWKVTVTPPALDPALFAGTLDLVLPDGRIIALNPYAGSFEVERL